MSNVYNPPLPTLLRCPIHQKEGKRKEKEKLVEMSTPNVKYDDFKDELRKIDLMTVFAQDYTLRVKKSRSRENLLMQRLRMLRKKRKD